MRNGILCCSESGGLTLDLYVSSPCAMGIISKSVAHACSGGARGFFKPNDQEYGKAAGVVKFYRNICVYSDSEEDHLRHLAIVLRVLRENNVHIKLTKCTWGRRESEYLGVIAGNGFLRCSPAKLDAVRTWPTPKTQKGR